MSPEQLVEELVPIAAQLVGTVREYGRDDVTAVLVKVPDGRYDALAVVLAAMVDPDSRPSELLGWSLAGPVQSRGEVIRPIGGRPQSPREHGTERGYRQHRTRGDLPACKACLAAHSAANRRAEAS